MSVLACLFIGAILWAVGATVYGLVTQDDRNRWRIKAGDWQRAARREHDARVEADRALEAALLDRPDAVVLTGPWEAS